MPQMATDVLTRALKFREGWIGFVLATSLWVIARRIFSGEISYQTIPRKALKGPHSRAELGGLVRP
jgi:hypothetical protein